jgi:hypothetical protein
MSENYIFERGLVFKCHIRFCFQLQLVPLHEGVMDLLTGGHGRGGSQRGGVEECGDFVVVYVNVGKSKKSASKYKNDFWAGSDTRPLLSST